MGILEAFGHFLKKVFNTGPWNLVYRHIVGSFKCVWKMAHVGRIFGPFLAPNKTKIGQKQVFFYFREKCLLDSLET